MRRWKRGGVGGGDTTLAPLRVASCLISRGVARKNVSGAGGRVTPLAPADGRSGRKVGTSESSSNAGRLTSWRSGADVGGATIDGEG